MFSSAYMCHIHILNITLNLYYKLYSHLKKKDNWQFLKALCRIQIPLHNGIYNLEALMLLLPNLSSFFRTHYKSSYLTLQVIIS